MKGPHAQDFQESNRAGRLKVANPTAPGQRTSLQGKRMESSSSSSCSTTSQNLRWPDLPAGRTSTFSL
ncbi:hypothetical protein HPP92_026639, partial [Vanilla planifolia]